MFFLIHNIFAALQDVSSDALAVDVLEEGEIALANGLMFVSKGFGFMFAALILGTVLIDDGFQAALHRSNSAVVCAHVHSILHSRSEKAIHSSLVEQEKKVKKNMNR